VNVLARLMRSLRLLVSTGEVTRTDWGTRPPRLQLHGYQGEVLDRVALMTPFGVASRPPLGSRVVTVAIGADRSQLVALAAAHAADAPPEIAEGELAIHARGGAVVHLRLDGSVHVTGPVTVTGPITATGDVSDMRGSLDLLRTAFNLHTHPETGSVTGPAIPQV